MFLVDTNLLLYAANCGAREHQAARRHLETWRQGGESWMATWSIFYEFLRVATHASVFQRPLSIAEAWEFLRHLLACPSFLLLEETPRHAAVVSELILLYPDVRGNHAHDFHIAALMYEHAVREIRTADADFHRFGFLTVVNPVAAGVSGRE